MRRSADIAQLGAPLSHKAVHDNLHALALML